MDNAVAGLLGIARRGRNTATGFALRQGIAARKVGFVLVAEDCSERTRLELVTQCEKAEVAWQRLGTMEELAAAIGEDRCAAVGISNPGLAVRLKEVVEESWK